MSGNVSPEGLRAPAPYRNSAEHLDDELARVDLLVRAQVKRWRLTVGAAKAEQMWGMLHVTDAEIDRYLGAAITPPGRLPESLLNDLRPYWQAEAEVGQLIRDAIVATPAGLGLRLRTLGAAFGLSEVERDLILLCLLPEVDSRYRRIYGYLQDDASRTKPPVELLLQMVAPRAASPEAAHALFESNATLVALRLVSVGEGDENRSMRSVRLEDRVASYLLGSDEADVRLKGLISESGTPVRWDELLFDEPLVSRLKNLAAYAQQHRLVVRLHGPRGSGREKGARAVCTEDGLPLLRVEAGAAPREPGRWEQFVDLAYREARLRGAGLFWADLEQTLQDEYAAHRWDYLLRAADEYPRVTFLASASTGDTSAHLRDTHLPRVDFPVPHYELRRTIWLAYLPPASELPEREAIAETLAGAFQFTEGQVRDAVAAARELAGRADIFRPHITREVLYEACRKQAGSLLVGFARRIEPTRKLTLDDVILAEPNKRQLRELLDRIRLRGRLTYTMDFRHGLVPRGGLLALFVGSSGTGKTMAAELLASEQGVDLYKVDLSAVVSKWVGETEKNLNRVFAEAEDSNALLFFDECDALFGQRGEVKDARDRWANLEVNYLLQRVEEYSGVVVMATNLRQNIDEAFLRRIQVVAEFPAPDAPLRLRIWEQTLPAPPHTVLSETELRAVAERFAITGGSIRNVVLDASFRALAAGRDAINVRDVVDGVAREYQKFGKPITLGDFGEEFFRWVVADILSPQARV